MVAVVHSPRSVGTVANVNVKVRVTMQRVQPDTTRAWPVEQQITRQDHTPHTISWVDGSASHQGVLIIKLIITDCAPTPVIINLKTTCQSVVVKSVDEPGGITVDDRLSVVDASYGDVLIVSTGGRLKPVRMTALVQRYLITGTVESGKEDFTGSGSETFPERNSLIACKAEAVTCHVGVCSGEVVVADSAPLILVVNFQPPSLN